MVPVSADVDNSMPSPLVSSATLSTPEMAAVKSTNVEINILDVAATEAPPPPPPPQPMQAPSPVVTSQPSMVPVSADVNNSMPAPLVSSATLSTPEMAAVKSA